MNNPQLVHKPTQKPTPKPTLKFKLAPHTFKADTQVVEVWAHLPLEPERFIATIFPTSDGGLGISILSKHLSAVDRGSESGIERFELKFK